LNFFVLIKNEIVFLFWRPNTRTLIYKEKRTIELNNTNQYPKETSETSMKCLLSSKSLKFKENRASGMKEITSINVSGNGCEFKVTLFIVCYSLSSQRTWQIQQFACNFMSEVFNSLKFNKKIDWVIEWFSDYGFECGMVIVTFAACFIVIDEGVRNPWCEWMFCCWIWRKRNSKSSAKFNNENFERISEKNVDSDELRRLSVLTHANRMWSQCQSECFLQKSKGYIKESNISNLWMSEWVIVTKGIVCGL
jgi:hypothetical protein